MQNYKIIISKYTSYQYNKGHISLEDSKNYKNSFVLFFNDLWNDFFYISQFNIIFFGENEDTEEIGTIKIFNKEQNLTIKHHDETYYFLKRDSLIELNLLDEKNSSVLEKLSDYYSISNMKTYNNMLKILQTDLINKNNITDENQNPCNDILCTLKEITTLDNRVIENIEKFDWFEKSLLRDFNLSEDKNRMIVEFTKIKNEMGIHFNSYYILNNLSNIDKKYFENYLNKLYGWVNEYSKYIGFHEAKEIVNIISNNKGKYTEDLNKILSAFKVKFVSYTDFLQKIDFIIEINEKIHNNINRIKEILRIKIDELSEFELGHYTSLSTIKKLIKKEEDSYLRLTNARQMNDPLEGKNLVDFVFTNKHNYWTPTKRFVSSLTTNIDNLPMWNSYAKGATGAMLIYDTDYLKLISELEYIDIYKVVYVNFDSNDNTLEIIPNNNLNEDEIKELMNIINSLKCDINSEIDNSDKEETKKIQKEEYINLLQEIDFLFKKSEFHYENEYRIIANTEKLNSPLKINDEYKEDSLFNFLYCYLEVPIIYSKLILGPKSINIDYIGPYITYCNENIKIEVSRIDFR